VRQMAASRHEPRVPYLARGRGRPYQARSRTPPGAKPNTAVNFAYGCRSSHRTSLNYFWATTTAGLAMALVASSFSTRVIGNWRPLFSP
jgi:hypothetical protein